MSGNGYKALGFVVWKGAMWYLRVLRLRYRFAKRVGMGVLAAGLVAAVGAGVALAQRRGSSGS